MVKISGFVALMLLVSVKRAYAYLDPGTGSYIIQVIVGGALGGLYLVKIYWQKIVGIFNARKSNDEKSQEKPAK